MNKYVKQIKEGIVDQNPTLVQFLGMCPTLATTTSVSNAVGMGLAATAVLICSNVFITLFAATCEQAHGNDHQYA